MQALSRSDSRLTYFRRNGFLLIAPVLIWNLVFWPMLPEAAGGSEPVPAGLQWTEHLLRLAVFALPVFMTIDSRGLPGHLGWATYLAGLAIYFASWIPWLNGSKLDAVLLLLAPYVSPLVVFVGLATLCRSWPYACVAVGFVAAHAGLGLMQAGIY